MSGNERKRSPLRCDSMGSLQRGESGQGVTELSFLVVVLIVVLVGVIDLGRILMVEHTIINAAREGARIAALGDQTASQVQAKVGSYLQGAGLDVNNATITVSGVNAATAQPTTVTIGYPVESIVMRMVNLQDAIQLTSSSRMLHE